MENVAKREVRKRQFRAQIFFRMEAPRRLRKALAKWLGGVCRNGRHRLGMARHRWFDGEGANCPGSGRAESHGSGGKRGPNEVCWSTVLESHCPLSSAERHDVKLMESILDHNIVKRPKSGRKASQHLCAYKACAGKPAEKSIRSRRNIPHVRQRREEIAALKKTPKCQPRRWVVERAHSWLNRYRKLLVRFEKTQASYEGLLELACALTAFRQVITIYG